MKYFLLLGQSFKVQFLVSIASPSQSRLFCELHVLRRVLVPGPHDVVQDDQLLQLLQSVTTVTYKVILIGISKAKTVIKKLIAHMKIVVIDK